MTVSKRFSWLTAGEVALAVAYAGRDGLSGRGDGLRAHEGVGGVSSPGRPGRLGRRGLGHCPGSRGRDSHGQGGRHGSSHAVVGGARYQIPSAGDDALPRGPAAGVVVGDVLRGGAQVESGHVEASAAAAQGEFGARSMPRKPMSAHSRRPTLELV